MPSLTPDSGTIQSNLTKQAIPSIHQPMLVSIEELSKILSRSIPSLRRDDVAERLPAAVRIGGSKRWRLSDIETWIALDCPARGEFEAQRTAR
jgi:predicted DNA-binding transcriptional regulator AlpA